MNNISIFKYCYGCGVCAIICPEQIITLILDSEGCYKPQIEDLSLCLGCGLCLDVCAFNDVKLSQRPQYIKAFSGWSKNTAIRKTCSSGGIGYEIGKLLIEKGYKACAVRYNIQNKRAEHYISNSVNEFEESKGSKYVQSYTLNGFKQFNGNDKFVVFATPCQIDSINKFIKIKKYEDNFILIDFFCHGIPSYKLWYAYLNYVVTRFNLGQIKGISFRDKKYGWHSFVIMIVGTNKTYYSSPQKDLFYRLFLQNYCLNKPCYLDCKYKLTQSVADIRLGDLWGSKYISDNEGVSGILTFTERGNNIIEELCKECTIQNEEINIVVEGQMRNSPKLPLMRQWILKKLDNDKIFKTSFFLIIIDFLIFLKRGFHYSNILLEKVNLKNIKKYLGIGYR